jgi:predicted Zn-dependent protease
MRRNLRRWRIPLSLLLCGVGAGLVQPQENAHTNAKPEENMIRRAMRDELARSMDNLKLPQLDKPYFIAYRVHEARGLEASASCGSLLTSTDDDPLMRSLAVEVRVGDYAFDNSNSLSAASFSPGTIHPQFGFNELPLDDNYLEIRRQIWLATDGSYKQAVEQLAAKKAALQNKTRAEDLADFSKENATQTIDVEPLVQIKRADAETLVRKLSKLLGTMPGVNSSMVSLSVSNGRSLYLNSEGTFYEKSHPLVTLSAATSTQAADGMKLGDSVTFYSNSRDRLPADDRLAAVLEEMGGRLKSLRDAPTLDRYNGPVLFEGRAAAEIFGQEFAPALAGLRKPVSGMGEMEAIFERLPQFAESSFAGKIGARVLPEFLNVVDNPTLSVYGQDPLFGGYKVDDDGVLAHETRLVEGGILKTLLTARTPVEGVAGSTGNRRGGGPIPSNLIVEAKEGLSETELKNRLLGMVKKRSLDYGIVVRKMGGGSGASMEEQALAMFSTMMGQPGAGKAVLLAYKVYPDGREEMIRGAHLAGLNAESFRGIVAASKSATVFNSQHMPQFNFSSSFLFSFGAEAAASPSLPIVSYVVPSLLFEDLSLTKAQQETPKPPFSDPPPCTP